MGQPRHKPLKEPVGRFRDRARPEDGEHRDGAGHQQRRVDADHEEVAWSHSQRGRHAGHHECDVEHEGEVVEGD